MRPERYATTFSDQGQPNPPHRAAQSAEPDSHGWGARRLTTFVVHTPPEVYGSRQPAEGTPDDVWLADVGAHGWTVIGRDTSILQVPAELAAYKAAMLHMVLYPGQATRDTLVDALSRHPQRRPHQLLPRQARSLACPPPARTLDPHGAVTAATCRGPSPGGGSRTVRYGRPDSAALAMAS